MPSGVYSLSLPCSTLLCVWQVFFGISNPFFLFISVDLIGGFVLIISISLLSIECCGIYTEIVFTVSIYLSLSNKKVSSSYNKSSAELIHFTVWIALTMVESIIRKWSTVVVLDYFYSRDQRLSQDVERACNILATKILPVAILAPFTISFYTYKTWIV